MKVFIEPIGKLINEFSKLPGVGAKTAQRYAYKIIKMTDTEAENFAKAILDAKKNVHYCKICGNAVLDRHVVIVTVGEVKID